MKFYPSLNGRNNIYELAAAHLPCINVKEGGAPLEFDIFLEPTQTFSSAPLGQMAQLKLAANMNGVYATIEQGCPISLSEYTSALILESTTGQTLYVQIAIGETNPSSMEIWCDDFENAERGSNLDQRFCVDDVVTMHGENYIYWTGGDNYVLDILSRLLQLIQSNHKKPNQPAKLATSTTPAKPEKNRYKLESNPNNWRITKFYAGMVTLGKSITTTTWSDLELQSIEGDFCQGDKKGAIYV